MKKSTGTLSPSFTRAYLAIKEFERQVLKEEETRNPIINGFNWSEAIDIGTSWSDLCTSYNSFGESKSEVAAL